MPVPAEFDRLRVVLVGTRNPLNLGAAARALSNFGLLRLRVVHPYPLAFREARSAVGASALLAAAQEFGNLADAIADCTLVVGTTSAHRRELNHEIRYLEPGARAIRQRLRSQTVAVLFGSEKVGLSNESMSHCHWLMQIPTREEHPSMNLGQAVAVCLYELSRNVKAKPSDSKRSLATAAEAERLTGMLLDVLEASGYLKSPRVPSAEAKVRRFVRRLSLGREDAKTLLGMVRQIAWKFGTGK